METGTTVKLAFISDMFEGQLLFKLILYHISSHWADLNLTKG